MKEQTYFSWWTRGDWNGFFGLFTNIITNLMVMSGLLLFAVGIPANIVFGRVMPAVGVALIIGNVYYGFAARRLAHKEKRDDVTALPYGPTVGHMFIVSFLIIGPVFWSTGNPVLAWQVGIAWCVIEAFIEIFGFAIGPFVRKHTPRAAMLGVVAGLSLTLIAMRPAFETWEVPYIAFVSLGLVLLGWLANKKLPGNIPHGLAIIIIGTAIGWITGYMRPEPLVESVSNMSVSLPWFRFGDVIEGFKGITPYLAVALPLGIGNAVSTLNNIESAAAAGDEYDTRECMIVDGVGTLIGAMLGSPFTTTVYIGHAGWKNIGARAGYSVATGIASLLICVLGVVPILLNVVPLVAVLPILLYIGLVMGAQAFQATPKQHAPVVILAIIPWVAMWGINLVDNALNAAGTNAYEVGIGALENASVLYNGMNILSNGAIITSMVIASVAAYVIDHKFKHAAIYALAGAVFSFFGFVHADAIGVGAAVDQAIGYAFLSVLFFGLYYLSAKERKDLGGESKIAG
ncbi:MAG: hypothetical protein FH749_04265 [Firmicutes bacterium]|nr:hypothetical protein [Bacillota bacterium]